MESESECKKGAKGMERGSKRNRRNLKEGSPTKAGSHRMKEKRKKKKKKSFGLT
jgi:hypothetical protein